MMKPKKGKKVMGKRKKLDMDKDGKLTKKDFAMLRKKKKKYWLKHQHGNVKKVRILLEVLIKKAVILTIVQQEAI